MIVAITVTYNRTRTLKNTLKALIGQTVKLDKIVVVDNGSKQSELNVISELKQTYGDIMEVIYLHENRGGAGGFEAGMKYAQKHYNPDWYWIMDDDAYPRTDCLEQLLKYTELDNIGCLCPVAYGIDLNKYQLFHHKKIDPVSLKETPLVSDYDQLKEVNQLDANAFVGPMISKKAVEQCGVANGGLFIYGDDTEYTYRLKRNNFNVYLIKSAIIEHQDLMNNNNVLDPSLLWKEYYMIRNTFLFIDEFAKEGRQKKQLLFKERLSILKSIIATYVKPGYKGVRKIRVWELKKAVSDGMNNRLGKTIDPQEFRELIKSHKK